MRLLLAVAVFLAACWAVPAAMAADQAKPDQVQAKPDQAKPDQVKPDQCKPDQCKSDGCGKSKTRRFARRR